MRELTYFIATSLDGRIAAADGSPDAFPVEGDHMAAIVGEWSDTLPTHVHAALGTTPDGSRFDTVVMGWRTYTPALELGIDRPYEHLREIVASRQDRTVAEGVELTSDPVATVRALKRESGGGIWLAGGGELAGALSSEIDRLVLKVNPFVYGDGRPLFGPIDGTPVRFELEASRRFASGVLIDEYRRGRG